MRAMISSCLPPNSSRIMAVTSARLAAHSGLAVSSSEVADGVGSGSLVAFSVDGFAGSVAVAVLVVGVLDATTGGAADCDAAADGAVAGVWFCVCWGDSDGWFGVETTRGDSFGVVVGLAGRLSALSRAAGSAPAC